MNTTPSPAFTLDAIRRRVREMRDIAAASVRRVHGDLDRDEETLAQRLHVPRWLWVPSESGTQLAALEPHGKRWAKEVLRHGCSDRARRPTPYLVTPDRVTAITWEVAAAMVEDLPDPDYVVVDRFGAALLSTREWRLALSALQFDQDAAALAEAATGSVLATKPTIPPV